MPVLHRKRKRVEDEGDEEDKDFQLLQQVLHILEIKDIHHLSENALLDILYHRKAFDKGLSDEWPETFDEVVNLLKRVGYMDPADNTYRFCAANNHVTVFYPEGK